MPGAITIAEESTSWPLVTKGTDQGGLGFDFKWNMGWMHDTLKYFERDPLYRRYFHNNLTFGFVYAWSENYLLPFSHDEVVHMKGSMLTKMFGSRPQKFANLRALYGYMWAHRARSCSSWAASWRSGASGARSAASTGTCSKRTGTAASALVRDLNRLCGSTRRLPARRRAARLPVD